MTVLQTLDNFLTDKPAWLIGSAAFALILFIAAVDYASGHEISVSVFYLIPISIVAWYVNRKLAYVASAASGAAWMIVEATSALTYSQPWILFWNGGVRLVFFSVIAYLFTELRDHLDRQRQLARTDNLTGVLNRAGFMDRADAIVSTATRYRHAYAVAVIDLDGFKGINDTLGHSHGDAVLTTIGSLLGRASRDSDIVARIGGDEFAVLLPETNLSGAQIYFDNLHEVLQQEILRNGWAGLGVSIGAAVFDRKSATLAEALQHADTLMYRAKRSGRPDIIVEEAN